MNSKSDARTAKCDRSQAQIRLTHAKKFFDVAELVASELVHQVSPGGVEAAKHLDRLLDIKETAHYGVIHISGPELKSALRNAQALVKFGESSLRR